MGDTPDFLSALTELLKASKAVEDEAASAPPAEPASSSPRDADAPFPIMFLCSPTADGGRSNLTTLGLFFRGVPEMLLPGLAGNHLRAGRFLVNTIARKLASMSGAIRLEDAESEAGLVVTLTRDDVAPNEPFLRRGAELPPGDATAVWVRLHFEPFGDDTDEPAMLLRMLPMPGFLGDPDLWLRDTCRTLGQDAPDPLPSSALDREIAAAAERARATLPAIRERFCHGLAPDESLLVKVALVTSSGGGEHVWVRVVGWEDDNLSGILESKPHDCSGYTLGQEMRFAASDVEDRCIASKTRGIVEPGLTDIIVLDFGVDIGG